MAVYLGSNKVSGSSSDIYSIINEMTNQGITAFLGSNVTLTDSNPTKLNLTTSTSLGDQLTLEDGGIRIGAGITKIKVSGQITFATGLLHNRNVYIYCNDTMVARSIFYTGTITGEIQPTITITEKLIEVNEGDMIYLKVSGANGTIVGSNNVFTYMTVEQVPSKLKASDYEISTGTILDLVYPIGSIYLSVNNVNPSNFLGGTWERWGTGRVPVGVHFNSTEFNEIEKTGGSKTHTLTIDEMPSHGHDVYLTGSTSSTGTGRLQWTTGNYQTFGGSVAARGGGQPHNNLPPYIVCCMWKRTA